MTTLTDDELRDLHAWWRAANYLSRRPDLPARQPAAAPAAGAPRTSSRGCSGHWGTTPGLNLLWTHLNRLIRERDVERDLPGRARARRPGGGGQRLARGHLQRGLPARRPTTRQGCSALFRQFSFPGGIPSHVAPETPGLDPRGRRARLRPLPRVRRRDGQPRPAGRRGRRRRRVRDRTAGHVLARQQVRRPGARRRGAADPAPQRLQDRQPDRPGPDPPRRAREPAARLRPRGAHRRGRRPDGRAPAAGRGAGHRPTTDPRDPAGRPGGRRPRAAAVADDPAGHPQGLDRPARGRRRAGRGHLARAPGAAGRRPARTTRTARCSRSGCGPTAPRSCSTTTAGWCRELRALAPGGDPADERQPARQRRPAAPAAASCRDFRDHAVDVDGAGRVDPRGRPGCSASTSSTWCATTPTTSGSSGRTRPRPTGSTPSTRSPTRSSPARSSPVDEHLARSGRVVEMLSEHTCQGWLEGYLLTGRHGLFSCYEAFIHLVDSMVNQHAKWLKTTREHRVAPADRLAQLPAHLARLAPGPQRVLPPGPRLHRPRGQQEGRGRPGLPAAGHQHAAVDDAALPGEHALRQRRRGRQAAVVRLAGRRGGRPALRARAGHLGLGVQRRRRPGRGDRLRRRRTDAGGAGRDRASCASTCPTCRCGSSTSST